MVTRRLAEEVVTTEERLPLHHIWLLEKLYDYVNQNGIEGRVSFVYDSQNPKEDSKLSYAFTSYLFKHPRGRQLLTRITPSPFFVNSTLMPGVQIADMVAGCIRHQAEIYNKEHKKSDDTVFKSRIYRYMNHIRALEVNLSGNNVAIYYASEEAMERLKEHAAGIDGDAPADRTAG